MFVARDDRRPGMGANFVVDWAADGPISEPVVEAVMIGTQGNVTYSFVSQGRRRGSCIPSEALAVEASRPSLAQGDRRGRRIDV